LKPVTYKLKAACFIAVLTAPLLFSSALSAEELQPSWAGGRTFVVGFAQDTMSNDWRASQVNAVKEALAKYPYIRFVYTDAKGSTAQQVLDIENLVEQGIDLLITSPRDGKSMTPVISSVYKKRIPVMLLTRQIESDDFTIFLGADDHKIGAQVAERIAERLHKKGRVVMVTGVPTATTAIKRTEGFFEALKAYPEIKVVAKRNGNYLRGNAIMAMDELLNEGVMFDAIYAQSDSMAVGIRMALKKNGINPKSVPIVGIDYISEAREAIRSGEQDATFIYPTCGPEAEEYILKILKGEQTPKYVDIPSQMITIENVEQLAPIF